MGQGEGIKPLVTDAKKSQELIANPEVQKDPDYRDYLRASIADIQKIVAETRVAGRTGETLDAKLHAFGVAVEDEIEKLAIPYATDEDDILGIVPEYQEFIKEHIVEALRVHLIGFFRANETVLSGTIFEDPITNEEQKGARSHYIQEFIANFVAHFYIITEGHDSLLGVEEKALSRLSTRKLADFSASFFYGPYIHDTLQQKNIFLSTEEEETLFTDADKRKLLAHNLATLEETIERIGRNWIQLANPDYLSEHAGALPVPALDVFSIGIRRNLALNFSDNKLDEGIERVGTNYRLLADTQGMVGKLEKEEGIRITSGAEYLRDNFSKDSGVIFAKKPLTLLAKWLREDRSFGRNRDVIQQNIVFEDLRLQKPEKK